VSRPRKQAAAAPGGQVSPSPAEASTVPVAYLGVPGTSAAPARERADAARNRRKVLTAAQALFAEHGIEVVTMDDVALAAGVGKGTLYRRFGDKGGLAAALLDERERDLQARMLAGPPPLGPDPAPNARSGGPPSGSRSGTPPAERLAAFTSAYLAMLHSTLDLVLLSETSTPGARHRTGAHAFWATHCRLLLQASGAPDPAVRADVLLAALAADQVRHWRDNGLTEDDLDACLGRLARSLATPADRRDARGDASRSPAGRRR
jgi:AcrR family transcriptional regulator